MRLASQPYYVTQIYGLRVTQLFRITQAELRTKLSESERVELIKACETAKKLILNKIPGSGNKPVEELTAVILGCVIEAITLYGPNAYKKLTELRRTGLISLTECRMLAKIAKIELSEYY